MNDISDEILFINKKKEYVIKEMLFINNFVEGSEYRMKIFGNARVTELYRNQYATECFVLFEIRDLGHVLGCELS